MAGKCSPTASLEQLAGFLMSPSVAYCSAKAAVANAYFTERKATFKTHEPLVHLHLRIDTVFEFTG
ncbi:hypothetical protein CGZ80_23145 [Rhodopirellula sp. MGV]|nr:hypothetical protein CGZ80_23145 [Rhodopirellula sp. MGV]